MRWFDTTLGRRLVFRLYFYHAVLFACIVATMWVAARLVVEPTAQAARREALTWVAVGVLAQRDAPERLQRQVTVLHERTGIRLTLFSPEGRVLLDNAPAPIPPLDAAAVSRLVVDGSIMLPSGAFAVGEVDEGRLTGYAIVDWKSLHAPTWRGALFLAVALVLLGVGSALLARAIARPLERLAKVTRAFGLGDLRARAGTDRKDEIGDLGRTFDQMADRVESLRRVEKELLANVSHELRTPLARIRVVVELAADGDPEVTQRYLAEIAEDLTEIEQLLEDIITAARLDLSNERANDPYPPLRLTPAPLGTLVEAVVRRFRDAHAGRAVHTTIECDPTVPVDRVMFKHALSNVLENAHKYSLPSHPIELLLHLDETKASPTAVVEVLDHGHGIDADDVPHVFTAFFRADKSRTRGTGGVGLGLTLARRIVEAHGGTIDLTSVLGEGTAVRIALPARAGLLQVGP